MSESYGNDPLCEREEGILVETRSIDHIAINAQLPKNHNEDAIEDIPEHSSTNITTKDRTARISYQAEVERSPMRLAKAAIRAQASNENRIVGYNMPIQHRSKAIHVDEPNSKEPHRASCEGNQVERPTRKNFPCVSPIRQARAALKINALHEVHTEPLQHDEKALRVAGPQLQHGSIINSHLLLGNHPEEASSMKLNDKLPIALPAEVIDEPLMADIVDEEAQRTAATKLLRRRIGIVSVVFIAVLAAVLGGFCGSGKCQKSAEQITVHDTTSTAAATEECRFLVEPDFNLVTTTYRQHRPLDSPFFTACEPLNGESFTENNTCRTYFHQTCQEPPYRIRMIFSGGGCNQSFGTDGIDFTCQDGPSGGPSHEIGYQAFITVSDVRKEDVVYFEDYVAVGDAFTLSNRGDDVGPDLLLRIYSSNNTEDPKALLQNIYYYSICTSTQSIPFHVIGSVQLFGFNFGSQTILFDSTTVKLEFELYLDGSNALLQNNRTITVDQVSLISSFTDPIVKKELNVKLTRNVDEATSKIKIALFDFPITWSQNKTNGRFSLRADVQGTGPDGQPCSGIGTLNFIADYI